jgi:streptogramin lyase
MLPTSRAKPLTRADLGPEPKNIVEDANGAMWFTKLGIGNQAGRVTTTGAMMFSGAVTTRSSPSGITIGPDGAL